MTGIVSWVSQSKTYGFVESGEKKIFVHLENFKDLSSKTELKPGDTLSFDVARGIKNNPKAINIEKIQATTLAT